MAEYGLHEMSPSWGNPVAGIHCQVSGDCIPQLKAEQELFVSSALIKAAAHMSHGARACAARRLFDPMSLLETCMQRRHTRPCVQLGFTGRVLGGLGLPLALAALPLTAAAMLLVIAAAPTAAAVACAEIVRKVRRWSMRSATEDEAHAHLVCKQS